MGLKFVMNVGCIPVYSTSGEGTAMEIIGGGMLLVHADSYDEFDADGNSTLPPGFPTAGQVLIVPEGTDHMAIENIFKDMRRKEWR